jgi:hypothetical protein
MQWMEAFEVNPIYLVHVELMETIVQNYLVAYFYKETTCLQLVHHHLNHVA